jgi:DNA-binding response OmpR family regulator
LVTEEPPAEAGEPAIEILDVAAEAEVVHSVNLLPGPARILVVDDEPAIRLLVQRALQHQGYLVEVAADGQEALDKVRAQPPDLLLLDAMLPRLHGFEVARRVRSDPATRAVPIVMMTAVYRGWRFAQDARESYGAEDYVEKPFRVDDLLRRVGLVLEATAARPAQTQAVAEPALALGREHLAAGRPREAATAFEEATRIDPFSAEAHFQMGAVLRALDDGFRAMTALERAVELRPGLFAALRALASLYEEKGFRHKAAGALERAVAAAPDDAVRAAVRKELLQLL